ncbi:auxin-responsive protein SAUR68-like [Mangifera indica]|uniref:auxin-responsive protein SAUR68-like n=1 Tax=Mangifera indica TaxID=29780 RepID=UPI001CFBE01A|nr:auxin-responsive protein SAUR68-like [Mangifera indica]
MISFKNLIKLARKGQRIAALKRERISLQKFNRSSRSSSVVNKGHFVAYTRDQKRFVFPITYLSSHLFQELLRMSEEEFGLPSDGPITLPCDASFMEYATSLIKSWVDRQMEEALVMSIASSRCSSMSHSIYHEQVGHQLVVCN